jgi:hypothetical protein
MSEAVDTSSTTGAPGRPLDDANPLLAMHGEACWLEGCALLCDADPAGTHAALRERPARFLSELHSVLMERAYTRMRPSERELVDLGEIARSVAAEQAYVVTATTMRDQCERFRSNPGAYLPGARPSAGVAMLDRSHLVDGWITVDGEDVPWSHGALGVSAMTVFELARYVLAAPDVRRGVVVGTHLQAGVTLPPEILFASLATPGPEVA